MRNGRDADDLDAKPAVRRDWARRLWPFNSEALCDKARRATGLQDFGDPPIEEALSVLAESLEREANLHQVGRFLMRMHLLDLLKTRLRLVDAWKRQPQDYLDFSPIARPIFITGTPRSGSTFLHELLAADPGLKGAPELGSYGSCHGERAGQRLAGPTCLERATSLWWFPRLSPGADAVYPMRARTPHECVAIYSYCLASEEFVSSCRVPAYEAFLRSTDLTPVYQWERRFLRICKRSAGQALGVESAGPRLRAGGLVLRLPGRSGLHTHRDPLQVLKSSIHLNRVLRGLYEPPDDPFQLAEREARVLAGMTDRFIRFRAARPELADRFIDVDYTELTADPLAVINRIYARFESLTPEAERRIRRLAAGRPLSRPSLASEPCRYRLGRAHPGRPDWRAASC